MQQFVNMYEIFLLFRAKITGRNSMKFLQTDNKHEGSSQSRENNVVYYKSYITQIIFR